MTTVQETIEKKVRESLDPVHLEVINESHMHSVPPGSESHFKVVVVSPKFEGKRLVARHQSLNTLLAAELKAGVHALSLQTMTADEWTERDGAILDSPSCLGGSKKSD
jgi:BolA family transcriptional regulator, general stress-responsive regulator